MRDRTALVTVVSGDAYYDYALALFESARENFHPTEHVELIALPGREGWPDATMYRPHVLRDEMPDADFVYLIDADMIIAGSVGPEILPPRGIGLTATLHPGYAGQPRAAFPYETEPESACFMDEDEGVSYYCGGFYGGERLAMRILLGRMAQIIDADVARGHTPRWHDESALNRIMWCYAPDLELDPRYCAPDNASGYQQWWPEDYRADARIVALDKEHAVRGAR